MIILKRSKPQLKMTTILTALLKPVVNSKISHTVVMEISIVVASANLEASSGEPLAIVPS